MLPVWELGIWANKKIIWPERCHSYLYIYLRQKRSADCRSCISFDDHALAIPASVAPPSISPISSIVRSAIGCTGLSRPPTKAQKL